MHLFFPFLLINFLCLANWIANPLVLVLIKQIQWAVWGQSNLWIIYMKLEHVTQQDACKQINGSNDIDDFIQAIAVDL